jgi:hypothetical protein
MTSPSPARRALIFGASGITGWAVAKEALIYPTSTTFDQVIGLTNRPLTKTEALLPGDERLRLYSGIDLTAGSAQVEEKLKKIDGIEGVTHVYFSGKIHNRDETECLPTILPAYTGSQTGPESIKANVAILQIAVEAVGKLCPKLQVWVLQTGGKVSSPVPVEFGYC